MLGLGEPKLAHFEREKERSAFSRQAIRQKSGETRETFKRARLKELLLIRSEKRTDTQADETNHRQPIINCVTRLMTLFIIADIIAQQWHRNYHR